MRQQLPNFDELFESADALTEPVGVAVAGGDDSTVLEALAQAAARGWVRPILCGNAERIRSLAAELSIDFKPFAIVASEQPAVAAVEQIHAGAAELMMKGQIPTPDLMRAILNRETGLRTDRVIGQMVLMEIPRDRKTFLMADTGITIAPTVAQKIGLVRHTIETGQRLGCQSPRIAIMSATEKVNEALPDTLDIETIIEQCGDAVVSGPLSFDLAYDRQAGQRKGITDPVIGQADGMVFPNLLSANLTVKAIMYTADCRFGGMLVGTSAPVVFMSRADDVPTRLRSLAFTLQLLESAR